MNENIVYDFAWDPAKALSNARKHGITFDQAATSGCAGVDGLR